MSTSKTGNAAHDTAVGKSESIRQAAVAAAVAAGGAIQPTVKAADIAHYRSCLASALANGANTAPYIEALCELGTGGS